MLMNVLASALLFLFVGPFKHASSGGTKEAGVSTSQVKEVYIAVNDTLKLNCSLNASIYKIQLAQVEWRHGMDSLTPINFTYLLNNNTIQLRKNHTHYNDAGVYECGLFNSSKFWSLQKIVVVVGERPKIISGEQFEVTVYGMPVQKVIVEWPALQENVTNELFFGRVPAGNYFCEFNSTAQCRITPEFQNEMLSCDIGMDVLGKIFQRNELLNGCSATSGVIHLRCDRLCAKLLVKNSFGVSKTDPPAAWNLRLEKRCPPLHNLTVSFGEHHLIVRWQRPELVQEGIAVDYVVKYFTTSLLTGKKSSLKQFTTDFQRSWKIDMIKPFARYTFEVACEFSYQWGPPVYTEVTTKEAEPSEAPSSCEVMNRSRHESFVSFKLPSIDSWNGIPVKFRVYCGDQMAVVNTSLAELQSLYNRSAPSVVMLKNLDPRKNYTVRVAMCTGGGCGNRSEPCFIPDIIEDDSNKNVVASRGERNHTVVITWLAIAIGAVAGLFLVALIASLIRRKRTQRKERPSLDSILGPLNGIHTYENPFDDASSFCEDDQCYDSIDDLIPRPLLADGAVGNLPLTEI